MHCSIASFLCHIDISTVESEKGYLILNSITYHSKQVKVTSEISEPDKTMIWLMRNGHEQEIFTFHISQQGNREHDQQKSEYKH